MTVLRLLDLLGDLDRLLLELLWLGGLARALLVLVDVASLALLRRPIFVPRLPAMLGCGTTCMLFSVSTPPYKEPRLPSAGWAEATCILLPELDPIGWVVESVVSDGWASSDVALDPVVSLPLLRPCPVPSELLPSLTA